MLKKIRRHIKSPIVAVGGINLSNAKEAFLSGADSVSAISAVLNKKDVKKEIDKFQNLYNM
jgi:thiamine-phosphate pyrophosphorylase